MPAAGPRGGAGAAVLLTALSLVTTVACGSSSLGDTAEGPVIPTFPEDHRLPVPKKLSKLPVECQEMLPPEQLGEIFAGVNLDGSNRDIVGAPEPKIELITRTACYIGMPPSRELSQAKLHIGLGLYATAESAKQRLNKAVEDKRAAGAQPAQVPIGRREALLLTGPEDRTLAYQSDTLTLLVSLRNGVAADDRAPELVTKVSERILRHLGQ